MTFTQRLRERWFDDWLDQNVSDGAPLPDPDELDEEDFAALQPVIAAASQLQAQTRADPIDDTAERHAVWEQIMQNHHAVPTPIIGSPATSHRSSGSSPVTLPRVSRLTWTGAISATLAAVLLIALIVGYRGFDGRFGFGNDDGNGKIHFAAPSPLATPDATADVATSDPFTIYEPVENPYPESDEAVYRVDQHQCSTEPISRDDLIASLSVGYSSETRYAPPNSESVTVSDSIKQELAVVANEFMACFVQGKPMSALALTTDTFRQQFVFNQLIYAPGGISDTTITAFIDQLVAQQQAAEADPQAYAAGTSTYLPTFDGDQGRQTTEDGRIYAVFNWLVRTDPARNDTLWQDRHPLFAQPPYQMIFIANMDMPHVGAKWSIDAVSWKTMPSQG